MALGIAHQNHESLGNVHPTDTENFMRKRRLRQQKSNRIPILIKFKLIKTDFFIKS
ncbi:asl2380 [Nostoc sp. PCC 7120 = FACHB-418]|nr:asl2380 [Nostoc sp. PCC 7120 = FACHB-418]